jgi:hypothetical protein
MDSRFRVNDHIHGGRARHRHSPEKPALSLPKGGNPPLPSEPQMVVYVRAPILLELGAGGAYIAVYVCAPVLIDVCRVNLPVRCGGPCPISEAPRARRARHDARPSAHAR